MHPQNLSRTEVRCLLRQYQRIKAQKTELAQRRSRILSELGAAADHAGKLRQLERLMAEQETAIVDAVLQILDIINILPPGSRERDIIERRYLDGLSWTAIARILHISRSQAAEAEKRGIDAMLSDARIAQVIHQSAVRH